MYGAWALWYLIAAVRAGMVELVDAPDSKSGGLRPLRVRVPLPALVPSDCRAASYRTVCRMISVSCEVRHPPDCADTVPL
jgi:hypothetical protein